jgi:hypothetical protein
MEMLDYKALEKLSNDEIKFLFQRCFERKDFQYCYFLLVFTKDRGIDLEFPGYEISSIIIEIERYMFMSHPICNNGTIIKLD